MQVKLHKKRTPTSTESSWSVSHKRFDHHALFPGFMTKIAIPIALLVLTICILGCRGGVGDFNIVFKDDPEHEGIELHNLTSSASSLKGIEVLRILEFKVLNSQLTKKIHFSMNILKELTLALAGLLPHHT